MNIVNGRIGEKIDLKRRRGREQRIGRRRRGEDCRGRRVGRERRGEKKNRSEEEKSIV